MPYVARNTDRSIALVSEEQHEGATEYLPDDHPDLASLATPRGAALADAIRREFRRRIIAVVGDARNSMNSYLGALNAKLIDGAALSATEAADRALLRAVDAWESGMVDRREALIRRAASTFADDANWLPPPDGVTADWIAGF